MPTPVSAARQCLTEEAARALDDAVALARRRNHAQTTSLHAVSALLALPSAALRGACARARSRSYSPRLQFRALELSVGVSLDRLPTTKTSSSVDGGADDGPPVSNSLIAAIRRSQANQRRHPENFHLLQMMQHQQQGTTSFLKVELKHFMLSILDDPIVSRVFAEAGFRSYDIKLALLQPTFPSSSSSSSRFFSRPVFLCNLEPAQPGSTFLDDNSKRIVEVLLRKNQRNPLLMGVYAKSALNSFIETVRIRGVLLPCELAGLSVICVEKEIVEFLSGSEEKMGMKFKEVSYLVEQCKGSSGGGVVVNFGEIEGFVGDGIGFVVEQLKRLLEVQVGKVWLIGVAGTSDAYSKFLGLFPTVDKDWDLQLLTMTSATTSMEGIYSKSSLMGSFVPFGGFFSTPSEFKSPISCTENASFTRCDTCNEKYEQEVADFLKVGPATSAKCGSSTCLPWLQKVNVDTDRGLHVAKTIEENTSSNAKIFELQKKWNGICQRLHNNQSLPVFDIHQTRFQAPSLERFPFGSGFKESNTQGLSLHEIQYSNQISNISKELRSTLLSKQTLPVSVPSDTVSINTEADHVPRFSKTPLSDLKSPWISPSPKANMNLLDHKSSSSVTPVTTDLGLGTIYTSAAHEPDTPKLCDHKKHLQHLSDSMSTDFDAMNENNLHQIPRSSSCSGPNLELKFDSVDFKSLYQILTEKVGWQDEAIYAISRAISLCRSGAGQHSGSHVRADIWLAFLGPDRLGKRKIASALAETLFGNKESLISVDLSSQDSFYPFQNSSSHDMLRRKIFVDYIAGELSKKPHSVVFLENVDKADFLVQSSLFQAIRTGRFPYSLGRQIGINNAIFVVTSTVFKGDGSFVSEKDPKMFPEERILEAKRFHMQLSIRHTCEDVKRIGSTNVMIAPRKGTSKPSILNKRKLLESIDSKEKETCKIPKQDREALRSYLDLNIPLEEDDEDINYNDHETESLVEKSVGWLNDFCDQIDGKVVFKPFNFDLLAEQVIKSIDIQFQRSFGSEVVLEIDYEVMVQILAAAWLSDKNSVQDWVERVLGRSFNEAQQKYHPSTQHVMKLVKCESIFIEEHDHGVCLPPRINLN